MVFASFFDITDWLYVLKDALELGLIWSLLSLGVFITFRILDYADLSIESTIVTGGAISILFINCFNFPPLLAFVFAFIVGCLCGVITGVLHTFFKIPGILAGIIVMTGLSSVNMRLLAIGKGIADPTSDATITGSRIYRQFSNLLGNIGLREFAGPLLGILFVVFVFIALYWFFGTEYGMSLRATGNNKQMAKAQGINTAIRIIVGLAISNGLVALCGALLADQSLSMSIDKGRGTIVVGLVSIVLGEAIFGKKSFFISMLSVVIGSICYQLLYSISISFFNINPTDLKLIASILITIILIVPIIRKKTAKSAKLKELNQSLEEGEDYVGN